MTSYFSHARYEALAFVPESAKRVLEIGCGAGATLRSLREARAGLEWAGGAELDAQAVKEAETICDKVWCGNIEQIAVERDIPPGTLEAILCLDVLEHLVDPWAVVKRLSPLLAPGGRLIVSVPNIRNWKFIWKLLVRGDFFYREAGLLDRTHLRFFVRKTAVELAECGGLRCTAAVRAHDWRFPDARYLLSALSGGRLDEVLAKQWLIVAEAA